MKSDKVLRMLAKTGHLGDVPHVFNVDDPIDADRWAMAVIRDAKVRLGEHNRGHRAKRKKSILFFMCMGREYRLVILRRPTSLTWFVDNGRVGAGYIVGWEDGSGWEERSVGIMPEYRRKGFYTAVLGVLKKYLGQSVWSDKTLSAAAREVWKRVGTYDEARGRYRNPPRRRALSRGMLTRMDEERLLEALNYYGGKARR